MFALWLSSAAPAVPVSRKAGIISPGDDVARCLERADGKCTVAEKGLVQKGGTPGDSTRHTQYRKDYNDAEGAGRRGGEAASRPCQRRAC